MQTKFDVAIIGGGILGVSISYWLSELYDCSIALIEREDKVATQASSRNTGMLHRPFYLNPEKKRVFARASQKSYFIWKDLARENKLTWSPLGTMEVALDEDQVITLENYKKWSLANGMTEDEFELLNDKQVSDLEPLVKSYGAIFSKTDTCVDYGELTNFIFQKASKNGVTFLFGKNPKKISENQNGIEIQLRENDSITAKFLINAAGGGAIDVAHMLDLGKEYTDLHFRGEYWKVDEPFASKISRNIYSVARYKEFPFLDPHFIIRPSGIREIGPNAVLVSGPRVYKGLAENSGQFFSKLFERPMVPKLKLFTNGTFLTLVTHEWRSSLSKSAMCGRVKQFIPSIDASYLNERGIAGVRNSVIDRNGFVPEAILIPGDGSLHILNYNSPGASGAPAFSAYVISRIAREGHLDGTKKKAFQDNTWNFEEASDL